MLTCPNCGDTFQPANKAVTFTACASCGTTLFLSGPDVKAIGEQGEMHDAPLLFGIGDVVIFNGIGVEIFGHARFSYGRGFWDEFWGVSEKGQPVWVSVDEGDVVAQEVVDARHKPDAVDRLRPGVVFKHDYTPYTVTEVDQAECVAVRGSFDEELLVGETYHYINATAKGGRLLSAEIWPGGQRWFEGAWFDPYDLQIERAS